MPKTLEVYLLSYAALSVAYVSIRTTIQVLITGKTLGGRECRWCTGIAYVFVLFCAPAVMLVGVIRNQDQKRLK